MKHSGTKTEWVVVQSCFRLPEAQMVKSILEAEGLEVLLPDEHILGVHSFTSAAHNRQGGVVMAHLLRSRLYDIALVLLGAVALVAKRHINVGIVSDYGGNVAASFSMFFLLKLPVVPAKFQAATAAALALLATQLFEASNGFGFMSNTYDPGDYLANALGVAFGAGVNTALQLAARPRRKPNKSPGVSN